MNTHFLTVARHIVEKLSARVQLSNLGLTSYIGMSQ